LQAIKESIAIEAIPRDGLTEESADKIYRRYCRKDETVVFTRGEERFVEGTLLNPTEAISHYILTLFILPNLIPGTPRLYHSII